MAGALSGMAVLDLGRYEAGLSCGQSLRRNPTAGPLCGAPTLGPHTDAVPATELDVPANDLAPRRSAGVIH